MVDDFLQGFPTVTRDQVNAFLEEAKARMLAKASWSILLDECIDRRLAKELAGTRCSDRAYETSGGPELGGSSSCSSRAQSQFDAFVTVDRNLAFQQNIPQFTIAVVVLEFPPDAPERPSTTSAQTATAASGSFMRGKWQAGSAACNQ